MKAVYLPRFGDSSVLTIGEIKTPEPGPTEVLIKIDHTSVNPVDWKIREGFLKNFLPHEFPLIPGWDAAGHIERIGADVKSFKLGDAVYAYARRPVVQYGTYASFTVVDQTALARKPKTIDFAQAATVPLVALTAWQSLVDTANVRPGEGVLVLGGAGGVGSFGIQFAKHLGGRVLTTASAKNTSYVTDLGADHVIDYHADNLAQAVRLAGIPIQVVFDCVGGKALVDGFDIVEPGGRVVSIVDVPKYTGDKKLSANYVFVSPNGDQLAKIGALIDAGAIRLPEVKVMSIRDAARAMDENQERHVRGKVALRIDF